MAERIRVPSPGVESIGRQRSGEGLIPERDEQRESVQPRAVRVTKDSPKHAFLVAGT